VQAESDAIICNTTALFFFLRRSFAGAFSIFVGKGASTARMLEYLKEDGWHEIGETVPREEYDEVRFPPPYLNPKANYEQLHYFDKHIDSCRKVVKHDVKEEWQSCPCPRLCLTATYESALSTVLVDAGVTEALNIIIWSHAYSLLPYSTFILKRSFLLESAVKGSPRRLGRVLKMKKKIFDLETEPVDIRDAQNRYPATTLPSEPCGQLVSCVDHGHRRIGDKYTWTITLNTDGIRQPTKSIIPTTYASFRIKPILFPSPGEDNHGRLRHTPSHYRVFINLIAAPCLKHEYFVDPTDYGNPAHIIVPWRYGDISFAQLEALEDEEKPPGWTTNDLPSLRHGWEKFGCEVPVGWKWYDDEIEGLLRARWDGDSQLDGAVHAD
jgi:hypothetical protein